MQNEAKWMAHSPPQPIHERRIALRLSTSLLSEWKFRLVQGFLVNCLCFLCIHLAEALWRRHSCVLNSGFSNCCLDILFSALVWFFWQNTYCHRHCQKNKKHWRIMFSNILIKVLRPRDAEALWWPSPTSFRFLKIKCEKNIGWTISLDLNVWFGNKTTKHVRTGPLMTSFV